MSKRFHSGAFSKYIYFFKPEDSSDQIDHMIKRAVFSSSASVQPLNLSSFSVFEHFEAMHQMSKNYYSFVIRYTDISLNKLKILYDKRIFRIIKTINIEEKKQYLMFYCEEELD